MAQSLRQRATDALRKLNLEVEETRAREAAEHRTQRQEETLKLLCERFDLETADVTLIDETWGVVAEVDGMRFIATRRNDYNSYLWVESVRLLGICPRCREEVAGRNLTSLESLGSSLEEFVTDYEHECLANHTPNVAALQPTTEKNFWKFYVDLSRRAFHLRLIEVARVWDDFAY